MLDMVGTMLEDQTLTCITTVLKENLITGLIFFLHAFIVLYFHMNLTSVRIVLRLMRNYTNGSLRLVPLILRTLIDIRGPVCTFLCFCRYLSAKELKLLAEMSSCFGSKKKMKSEIFRLEMLRNSEKPMIKFKYNKRVKIAIRLATLYEDMDLVVIIKSATVFLKAIYVALL